MRSEAHSEVILRYRRENCGIFETLPVTLGYLRVAYSIESHLVEVPSACQTYCDALEVVTAYERNQILVEGVDPRHVIDR